MTMTRTSIERETARRLRHVGLQNGEDVRRMRLDAGVSLGQLADAIGCNRSHVARIENNQVQPSLEILIAIGLALGADLSVRYFPGAGPRLHDRFQAAMVEALLRSLDPRWSAELEVPVTQPSRGVIDLVLTNRASHVVLAVEVQSELRSLEQQIRWAAEKADGLSNRLANGDPTAGRPEVSRLLILRSTVATREIARLYEATLAACYPGRTRNVVLALTTSAAPWPGPGIAWMHVHGSKTTLMSLPPPGTSLGR